MKKKQAQVVEQEKKSEIVARGKTLNGPQYDPSRYEINDKWKKGSITPEGVKSTAELVQLLESETFGKNVEIDSLVLAASPTKGFGFQRLNKAQFIEAYKKPKDLKPFREAQKIFREAKEQRFKEDSFSNDGDAIGNPVGKDFIPLLGGPFSKQLYYHDALAMFQTCFNYYHHHPVARAIVDITINFVLGRGFRVDAKHKDPKVRANAQAWWDANEKVNNVQELVRQMVRESSIYGELMLWKLPDNQTNIAYAVRPGQEPGVGLIPRIRLVDPSTCWEIVTFPEDINRVLNYTLVFPTQYQLYTGQFNGEPVPSTKFIYQQIPADQIRHYKLNCVSNEKRGRSDFYPALSFMKRLNDAVDYSMIAAMKAGAWGIDTTIEGSPADLQAYIQDQESQGTIAPAGSEFAHTSKIKREYLGNTAFSSGGNSNTFEWNLNMICIATGIPVSYLGTHLSGGQTRASALVGTEPVAKKFQSRQRFIERIIQDWAQDLMESAGLSKAGVEWEITFPEIITQDRSAKIKDLLIARDASVFSARRAAEMIAKEFDVSEYEYDTEIVTIKDEKPSPPTPTLIAPLTTPAQVQPSSSGASLGNQDKPGAVTSGERADIAAQDR